jgi:hypothetical protein
MAKDAHNKAAEHHENAAKAHRMAAEHHGKGIACARSRSGYDGLPATGRPKRIYRLEHWSSGCRRLQRRCHRMAQRFSACVPWMPANRRGTGRLD